MNKEKLQRHRIFAVKYDIPLTILVIGVIVLSIFGTQTIISAIEGFELSVTLGQAILLYAGAIIALLITIAILMTIRTYYIRHRRYYEDIFASDRSVFSEKLFIDAIARKTPRFLNNAAIIAFSIFDLKKTVLNLFGYKMVAQIAGGISSTLINRYQGKANHDVVYGFDYNENFLLFLPFNKGMPEIAEEIGRLNEAIQKTINDNGLNMDINIFFGIYVHDNANISPYEMIRRSLIAADFGLRNKINTNQFEEYMLDANQTDLALSKEINAAIENKEFEIFYQPKFDIKLNRFYGSEALIR